MLQVNATTQFSSTNTSMSARLAQLSHKKQWVLFTSECPRPSFEQLSRYHVNCNSIVRIKPSAKLSEEEIVIRAIKARTASAVIASDNLSESSKNHILQIAEECHCEVFFVSKDDRTQTYH